jgi:acyl-CoA thioester hydrolase
MTDPPTQDAEMASQDAAAASPEKAADPLAGYAVVVEAHVAWGEMDVYAHVNNAVYFRWFESARMAYLEAIDFRGDKAHGGIGPILHSTHCRFRRPLFYPDTVRVGGRATALDGDRFTMEYAVVSTRSGEVAATGGGLIVAYDYPKLAKAALPDAVRRAILALDRGLEAHVG